jgi:hypothetical protein
MLGLLELNVEFYQLNVEQLLGELVDQAELQQWNVHPQLEGHVTIWQQAEVVLFAVLLMAIVLEVHEQVLYVLTDLDLLLLIRALDGIDLRLVAVPDLALNLYFGLR